MAGSSASGDCVVALEGTPAAASGGYGVSGRRAIACRPPPRQEDVGGGTQNSCNHSNIALVSSVVGTRWVSAMLQFTLQPARTCQLGHNGGGRVARSRTSRERSCISRNRLKCARSQAVFPTYSCRGLLAGAGEDEGADTGGRDAGVGGGSDRWL